MGKLQLIDFTSPKTISFSGLAGLFFFLLGIIFYAVNPVLEIHTLIFLGLGIAGVGYFIYYRWNSIILILTRRSTQYGLNLIVTIFAMLAILIFVQVIANKHHLQLDLSENKKYSLSDQTNKILKSLKTEIKAVAFYKPGQQGRSQTADLFKQYSTKSAWFKYEFVDPDRQPATARRYQITTYGTVVLLRGDKEEKITTVNEENLTNALVRVTRDQTKTIYITKGHGEKDTAQSNESGFSRVKKAIEDQNYLVKDVILAQSTCVPVDCNVLIIPGAKTDFFLPEIEVIQDYLKNNGKVLILSEPEVPTTNLRNLAGKFGVKVTNTIIADKLSRVFGGDILVPLVSEYPAHEITKNFRVMCFFPVACALDTVIPAPEGITATVFARTGTHSWAETNLPLLHNGYANYEVNSGDIAGPIPVAVAVNISKVDGKETKSKLVVFGDSDFVGNVNFALSGNKDLFLNTVAWLAEEAELISIRPKEEGNQPLILTAVQGRMVFWVPVIIVPLIVLGVGTFIITRRRRKV